MQGEDHICTVQDHDEHMMTNEVRERIKNIQTCTWEAQHRTCGGRLYA